VVSSQLFAHIWPPVLGALAVVLLLSGFDDLIPVLICAVHRLRHGKAQIASSLGEFLSTERRIAIFVPCWKESGVIGNMVRHNLAAICYRNYDVFLGVYPNDQLTVEVVNHLAETFRNVHVAACPHPGPTSKADCLNWIFCRMGAFEEAQGVEFDTVVLHDAEDLIHPEALAVINRERASHDMVQIPVLPLPTAFRELTHGIYCDEFAEFQTIDMPARQYSQSFIPSNGVGTASRASVKGASSMPRVSPKITRWASTSTNWDSRSCLRRLRWAARVILRRANISRADCARRSGSGRAGSQASRCNVGSGTAGAATGALDIGSGGIAKGCWRTRSAC
jgi:hypothetical protein